MQEPPYPAETKAGGFRLELDCDRLFQSDTWALANPQQRPILLMLLAIAWTQKPCGSLPGEDLLISARLGQSLSEFQEHSPVLLRGWIKATDGRLYHPVMTDLVLGMIDRKLGATQRKQAQRVRERTALGQAADIISNGTHANVTRDIRVTDNTTTITNTNMNTKVPISTEIGNPPSKPISSSSPPQREEKRGPNRGSRLLVDWQLPNEWEKWAMEHQQTWTVEHVSAEADKFRDYWVAKSGKDATKLDWFATWRNWVRNAAALKTVGGHGAWWASDAAKLVKANEVGVGPARPGEHDSAWEARIREAIDNGGRRPARIPSSSAPVIRESIEQIERDNSGSVLKDAALAQLKAITGARSGDIRRTH
ncbi:hypothetical protein [Herbaspirillum sp. NPDC087042]|uniref:hypothetical protein n=1 Tax=Herbaspirillum sp. NPDC087042 TaxID=3364004 RepID=UPI0038021B62